MINRERTVWTWIVYPMLAVVLYVLSSGPAWWLLYKDYVDLEPFNAIYAPLEWGSQRSRFINLAWGRYLQFWTPPEFIMQPMD